MRVAGLLVLCTAAACEPADDRAPAARAPVVQSLVSAAGTDSAAVQAVREQYPDARLWAAEGEPVPGTEWRAASFRFETPGDDTRYGAILAVWTADAGRLVWTREHRGDFTPHRLTWVDADRDGRTDLFFHAGEEDVFETYLFLNRAGRAAGTGSTFALAYRSGNDYTTLLDLDGDGAPELIDSGHDGEEHVEPVACQEGPLPDAVVRAAREEYARRAGPFGAANFTYGLEEFAPYALHLLDPVRIMQVRGGAAYDATRAFPGHLRWRIGVLEQLRAVASAECAAHVDGILRRLRQSAG